jgi:hypothetical protein
MFLNQQSVDIINVKHYADTSSSSQFKINLIPQHMPIHGYFTRVV